MTNVGFNLKLLSQLFQELDEDFLRTHKQIYFDLQLPYDKEKFKMFNTVLPKDKFIPIMERKVDSKKAPALIQMPEGAYQYQDLLGRATEKLH